MKKKAKPQSKKRAKKAAPKASARARGKASPKAKAKPRRKARAKVLKPVMPVPEIISDTVVIESSVDAPEEGQTQPLEDPGASDMEDTWERKAS
jgi:hypothetical protein